VEFWRAREEAPECKKLKGRIPGTIGVFRTSKTPLFVVSAKRLVVFLWRADHLHRWQKEGGWVRWTWSFIQLFAVPSSDDDPLDTSIYYGLYRSGLVDLRNRLSQNASY
jgi:hypothetical protein